MLFLLGINTDINIAELLKLNINNVKNRCSLVFPNRITMPINEEIRQLITIVSGDRDEKETLFVGIRKARLSRHAFLFNFKTVKKELNIDLNISAISLRKTFGYFHYMKYKILSYLQWLFNQYSVNATLKFIYVKGDLNFRFKERVCL